jgi:hypothetical protein
MIISGHCHSAPLQITKELTTENKIFWKVQLVNKLLENVVIREDLQTEEMKAFRKAVGEEK